MMRFHSENAIFKFLRCSVDKERIFIPDQVRLSCCPTVEPFLPGGPGFPEAPGGPCEANKKHITGRILARSLI